jgi:hypothetical protein
MIVISVWRELFRFLGRENVGIVFLVFRVTGHEVLAGWRFVSSG